MTRKAEFLIELISFLDTGFGEVPEYLKLESSVGYYKLNKEE